MTRTSTATAVDYGPLEEAMQAYLHEGEERAMALGNRGPIRFDADGSLHPDILTAFSRCGFYILEDALGADELADIGADFLKKHSSSINPSQRRESTTDGMRKRRRDCGTATCSI